MNFLSLSSKEHRYANLTLLFHKVGRFDLEYSPHMFLVLGENLEDILLVLLRKNFMPLTWLF